MNVHMVNEIESYLQLGRHNADNISLTELLSSSLFSLPVVARLSPGCKAYVECGSDCASSLFALCCCTDIASIGWSEYVLTVKFSVLKVQVLKISISKSQQQVLNSLSQSPQVKSHFLQTIHFCPQIVFCNFTSARV